PRAKYLHARQMASSLFSSSTLSGAPGTVDRAIPSGLNGSAKSWVSASNVIFRPSFAVRLVLVNSAPVRVAPGVSSLQLTLNLHNFRYIFRRERDLAGEDYKQDVDERVSRNVRQFSEQVAPPGGANRISDIHIAIRMPRLGTLRCRQQDLFSATYVPATQVGCGGRRALPGFGQSSSRGEGE